MPHQQDRRPGIAGDPGQLGQHPPHLLILVAVDLATQRGHQRIDHDQLGLGLGDHLLEPAQIIGQERQPLPVRVEDAGDVDPAQVRVGGDQAGHDDHGRIILEGDEDDPAPVELMIARQAPGPWRRRPPTWR